MKRTKLLRRSRLKARGPRTKKSGGHLFPKGVDEAYRKWIRSFPCIIGGLYRAALFADKHGGFYEHRCVGRTQVCHVKSRGAGGSDRGNCVPMCAGAHDEQHRRGLRSFEARYQVDVKAAARAYEARYLDVSGAAPVSRGSP